MSVLYYLQEADEKKEIDYLFIEADEDHVAEQHGDSTRPEENPSFISKLVYIHEGRQDAKGYKDRKAYLPGECCQPCEAPLRGYGVDHTLQADRIVNKQERIRLLRAAKLKSRACGSEEDARFPF